MSADAAGPSNGTPVDNELLLARALEVWLEGNRDESSSGKEVATLTPELQLELEGLLALAGRIRETTGGVRAADDFRAATRGRLMAQLRASASVASAPVEEPTRLIPFASRSSVVADAGRKLLRFPLHRATPWLARVAAGFFALILVGSSTLTASANALPGDPLYGVKQASEVITLQFALDDGARARAYLGQADARLDELARLLEQGREADAATLAGRYDDAWRFAAGHAASADRGKGDSQTAESAPATATLEAQLAKHQARIAAIIADAPTTTARAALERALLTSNRGRERSEEVRRARAEGELPGPAEQSSVRQGDEPRGASAGNGPPSSSASTATPGPRSGNAGPGERRGLEERPGSTGTAPSEATRGPRDGSRVSPERLTRGEDDPNDPEDLIDGAARDEQQRVRPPVFRTPTATDRRRTAPRESGEETRARSGSSSAR